MKLGEIKKDEARKNCNAGPSTSKKFVHKELGFFDLFANIKFGIFYVWYSVIKRNKEETAKKYAMNHLTST
jgi:hypothetical protein